jgi:2-polyprenyl-3-methyl-5-hydroxy-6-metoxy-1,4-benzoquinol methylase
MSEYGYSAAGPGCASHYLQPIVAEIVAALPKGSVVMDLGCGNGSTLAALRRSGLSLHGLDSSVSGVGIACREHPELDISVADVTADLTSHPLYAKCDLVITTEVVEHVFLPRLFVRNCYGFLRPGGKLVISTPYHGYLKNLVLAVTGRLDAHFTALWDYGHIKFWSHETLILLLREAGFEIEAFRGAGRLPFLWKSMVVVASRPNGSAVSGLVIQGAA